MPRKKQSVQTDAKKPTQTPSANRPYGSKSAFVRNLPRDLSAKEVVAKGKAEGIKLSLAQVYNIRSTANRKGPIKNVAQRTVKSAPSRSGASASSDAEAQMRKLIAEVGLVRARRVLAEVGAAFAG